MFMSSSLPSSVQQHPCTENTSRWFRTVISTKSKNPQSDVEQWQFIPKYINDRALSGVFLKSRSTKSNIMKDVMNFRNSKLSCPINFELRDSKRSEKEKSVFQCDPKTNVRVILKPTSTVQSNPSSNHSDPVFHLKTSHWNQQESFYVESRVNRRYDIENSNQETKGIDDAINGRKKLNSLVDITNFTSLEDSNNAVKFGTKYPKIFTHIIVNTLGGLVNLGSLSKERQFQIHSEEELESEIQNKEEVTAPRNSSFNSTKPTSTDRFKIDLMSASSSPNQQPGRTSLASENNISVRSPPNPRCPVVTIGKNLKNIEPTRNCEDHIPKLFYSLVVGKPISSHIITGKEEHFANFPESTRKRTSVTSFMETKNKPNNNGLLSVDLNSGGANVIPLNSPVEYNSLEMFPDVGVLLKTKRKEWDFKNPQIIRALYVESETNLLSQWKAKYMRVRRSRSSGIQNNWSSRLRRSYLQYKKFKTRQEIAGMDHLRKPLSRRMPDFQPVQIQSTLTSEYRHAFARNRPPVPYHYLEYFQDHKKLPFKVVQTKKTNT